MKLEWQQAPVKTQWGDEMVVASVAIDNDHTVCLYCERAQTVKVEAMFAQRKPLTDEEIRKANHHMVDGAYDYSFKQGVKWAEYKHGIKENI